MNKKIIDDSNRHGDGDSNCAGKDGDSDGGGSDHGRS